MMNVPSSSPLLIDGLLAASRLFAPVLHVHAPLSVRCGIRHGQPGVLDVFRVSRHATGRQERKTNQAPLAAQESEIYGMAVKMSGENIRE
jgi:hypothetical protein